MNFQARQEFYQPGVFFLFFLKDAAVARVRLLQATQTLQETAVSFE